MFNPQCSSQTARRFVILLHTGHGPAHYDLMIENGPALATWQFAANPLGLVGGYAEAPAVNELAGRRLPDHRLAYLDYEGPVSGGRGEVKRVERGSCRVLASQAGRWEAQLAGQALAGRFELRRAGTGDEWIMIRLEK
ncbi:MAG: hypothetical protein ACE15C_18030 [Phycisphaerae bacterium]